ncbi:hypothetical protein A2U01_0107876, partial [Trifolium medium]|nr:hypothetical protein [Trifolium medium]
KNKSLPVPLAQRGLARTSERMQEKILQLASNGEDQRASRYSSLVLAKRQLKNTHAR